jgi:hypothetical protein
MVSGIYQQIIRFSSQKPQIRHGKTEDFAERSKYYNEDIQRGSTRFHIAAGKLESYKMYPLISGLDNDEVRSLAKITTILQFGSFTTDVL